MSDEDKKREEERIKREGQAKAWSDFWEDAILPENMGFVNKMLQQGRSALAIATTIAFKEFGASLEPNFVDLHNYEVENQNLKKNKIYHIYIVCQFYIE